MNKLKPCPFCGGEVAIRRGFTQYCIKCFYCEAVTSFDRAEDNDSVEKAIEAWNRRVGNDH